MYFPARLRSPQRGVGLFFVFRNARSCFACVGSVRAYVDGGLVSTTPLLLPARPFSSLLARNGGGRRRRGRDGLCTSWQQQVACKRVVGVGVAVACATTTRSNTVGSPFAPLTRACDFDAVRIWNKQRNQPSQGGVPQDPRADVLRHPRGGMRGYKVCFLFLAYTRVLVFLFWRHEGCR